MAAVGVGVSSTSTSTTSSSSSSTTSTSGSLDAGVGTTLGSCTALSEGTEAFGGCAALAAPWGAALAAAGSTAGIYSSESELAEQVRYSIARLHNGCKYSHGSGRTGRSCTKMEMGQAHEECEEDRRDKKRHPVGANSAHHGCTQQSKVIEDNKRNVGMTWRARRRCRVDNGSEW